MTHPVVIIGAGLAGLSAALHLPSSPVLLIEREGDIGGKATTHRRDGFTFDVTGHWIHLRNPAARRLVRELLQPDDLVEIQRRTTVYTHGVMLPYPFQANIHGLPRAAMLQCLRDYLAARLKALGSRSRSSNFEEFIVRRFGRGMAEHFFIPYYTKFWGFSLEEITADWLERYLPSPSFASVLAGALGIDQHSVGYNSRFLYNIHGGIDILPRALLNSCLKNGNVTLRTSTDVERIDVAERRIRLSGSRRWQHYGALVSTIPVPAFIDRIDDVPTEIKDARRMLRSIPLRYLNIAIRAVPRMREHWVYTPEPDFPFYRMGIFTNASASMAPAGCTALWVELADRVGPVDIPATLSALQRLGAITSPDKVAFVEQHDIEDAYVVFDDAREQAVNTITSWLTGQGIHSCGRYGGWTYGSMEDSIVDGIAVAHALRGGT